MARKPKKLRSLALRYPPQEESYCSDGQKQRSGNTGNQKGQNFSLAGGRRVRRLFHDDFLKGGILFDQMSTRNRFNLQGWQCEEE